MSEGGSILLSVEVDQLTLTVGTRYFESDLDSREGTIHDFGDASTAGPFTNKSDASKTTGKIYLSFRPPDSLNVYATISQGFRVGGLNDADISFSEGIPPSYDSDELINFEVGLKTQFADGKVSLQAALYQIVWEDIQVEALDNENGIPFIINAGEAEINGLEVSVNASLSASLELQLGATIVNAELTEDQPFVDEGEDRGFDGDSIPNIPELQGYAALIYTQETALGELALHGDWTYRDDVDIRFDTASEFNRQLDAYSLINLRASLAFANEWKVSLYARTVNDEEAEYDAIASLQDPLASVGARPRTIGLGVRKDF